MKNSTCYSGKARFDEFEVDLRTADLRRHGQHIRLQEKSFQILSLLLERAGEVVTRDELKRRLWPADPFIHFEENLNTNLNRLRQALGDSASQQRLIRTIPRQGYRFIAPITWIEELDAGTAARTGPAQDPATNEGSVNPWLKPTPTVFGKFRAVLVTTLLLALALGGLTFHRWLNHSAEARANRATILVTPFENLSGDPNQDYLSDGLTDEMITRLGQTAPGHLSVIARSSVMQYKGAHKTVEQIVHEQHVDYILEGSFRRQGDQVRITAQLYNAHDLQSLWTEAYERDTSDLLVIQREVAERIAQSLSIELSTSAGGRLPEAKAVKPEAYNDYLKGIFEYNKGSIEDLNRSIGSFQLSSEKDPEFAPTLAALAFSYSVGATWTFLSPQDAYPKAQAAAQKALALDDSLADSHLAYGVIRHEYDWDWSETEKQYQRALELNPSSVLGYEVYAEYLTHAGRYQEALDEIRKAQQLDPASLVTDSYVCFVYMHARDYDKAIDECRKIVDLDPQFLPGHDWLADAYLFANRYDDAVVEFKKTLELSNNANYFLTSLAMTYGLQGDKQDARKLLDELRRRATHTYVSPFGLADVYIGLGDREQALAMLEKAVQEHSADLVFLATAPEFDSLHNDPRFKAMIARIGFPESALAIPASAGPPTAK